MTSTRKVDLQQGSVEWLAWRRERMTASEAAIVMGCAPSYWQTRTPDQLRAIKDGSAVAPEPSDFTKKLWADGHAKEAEIRDRLNEGWYEFAPACFELGKFGASLDGWDADSGEWLEVKCPKDAGSLTYRMATEWVTPREAVPDHYWWQIVHQAACAPDSAMACRYIVAPADGAPEVEVLIRRDDLMDHWPALEAAWQAFTEGRTNLPAGSDEALALEYIEALHEHDTAKQRLDRAKTALLAAGPRTVPELVDITESDVKGRIDWQAAARRAGMSDNDAEGFRGKASTRTAIKLLNGSTPERKKSARAAAPPAAKVDLSTAPPAF